MKRTLLPMLLLAACSAPPESLSITSVSPLRGSARGGETVFIDGTGFDDATTVRFGTLPARVRAVTATRLEVLSPTGAASAVQVEVASNGMRMHFTQPWTWEPLAFSLVDAADVRLTAGVVEGGLAATADYEGDGDPDVFQAARGEGVFVMVNDGAGALKQKALGLDATGTDGGSVVRDVWSVAANDFDGDGVVDLFLGTAGKTRSQLWKGNQTGGFSLAPLPALVGSGQRVLVLDVEPDGDLDLLLTATASNETDAPQVVMLTNDGHGVFTDNTQKLAGPRLASTGITAGDFDGDGDVDLFFAMAHESNRLFLGDGRGAFQLAAPDALPHDVDPQASLATLGDLNEDGFPDLFVPTATQDQVLINDGTAHFADLTEAYLSPEVAPGDSAQLVDFDLDGHLDVVVVDRPGRLRFLRNDGTGRLFDYSADVPGNDVAPSTAGVTLGDFDRDGLVELFVSRSQLARPSLFVNVLAGDVDSDGDTFPDRFDVCRALNSKLHASRAPFGCDSAADCLAKTGCELKAFGASAYLSCPMRVDWATAHTTCSSLGGSLAQITGADENNAVRSAAAVWIELTDAETEGTWKIGGATATWFNWAPMQPDNSNNEDCGSLAVDGKWNDLPCSGMAAVLCEAPRVITDALISCEVADGGVR